LPIVGITSNRRNKRVDKTTNFCYTLLFNNLIMFKIILFSTLLTIVYSWEETKNSFLILINKFRKRNKYRIQTRFDLDKHVGAVLILFTLPFSLTYALSSDNSIYAKLFLILVQMTVIALAAYLTEVLARRLRYTSKMPAYERALIVGYTLATLAAPTLRMINYTSDVERSMLARFSIFLTIPAITGIGLKYAIDQSFVADTFIPSLETLILVSVIALFIRIVVDSLEKYFALGEFSLMSYFRILIGIALSVVLLS